MSDIDKKINDINKPSPPQAELRQDFAAAPLLPRGLRTHTQALLKKTQPLPQAQKSAPAPAAPLSYLQVCVQTQ